MLSSSGSIGKKKTSNFPALLLKIGQWEYKSRYEGDLVAKCYFAKHKLVWEVLLEQGLKSKIEIQWSDIMALKANFPDDGPGTLTLMLARQPLFFREINSKPRKHIVWQSTSDFTNGEASMNRLHFLQCSEEIMDKHFEKLIQSDGRLLHLSQQQEIAMDFPYFDAPKYHPFENLNLSTGDASMDHQLEPELVGEEQLVAEELGSSRIGGSNSVGGLGVLQFGHPAMEGENMAPSLH